MQSEVYTDYVNIDTHISITDTIKSKVQTQNFFESSILQIVKILLIPDRQFKI